MERASACVYEPFVYRLKGDHRGFYFDIDEQLLFKNEFSDLEEFDSRGLFSRDKTTVAKYVDELYSHLM